MTILYKFLETKWALDSLKRKRLKISLLTNLNDPWDCRGVSFSSPDEKTAWEEMLSQFSQTHGVVCFSQSWANPVHWAHYARNHCEVALGFEVPEPSDSMDSFFTPVKYSKGLVSFPDLLNMDDHAAERFMVDVVTTKFEDWRYENEVRAVYSIDAPDPDTGNFYINFGPKLQLKSVVIGCRNAEPIKISELLAVVRHDFPGADFWRTFLGNQAFELARDPNWQYWTGN